jgi:splicing factor 45
VIQVTAKKTLVAYASDDSDNDDDDSKSSTDPHVTTPAKAGAAIAPPKELTIPSDPVIEPAVIAGNTGVSQTAAKIMLKMGYRDGAGLGRDEQGIAKPLMAVKTGVKQGRIQSGSWTGEEFAAPAAAAVPETSSQPSQSSQPQAQEDAAKKITEMMRNPTRVVLLTNMVGPGEVDDDLEPETKEECSKYGEVVKCVIFEIPGPGVKPEDAVRIFVEFKRIESAIKAVVDLNGRFFGGRTVRASFFDVDRFRNFDLMDVKSEKK